MGPTESAPAPAPAPPAGVRYRPPAPAQPRTCPLADAANHAGAAWELMDRLAGNPGQDELRNVWALRLLMLQAGLPAPPGETLRELIGALLRLGWRPVPAPLSPPTLGALYVLSNAERQPQAVGIVAKLHQAPPSQVGAAPVMLADWFLGVGTVRGRVETRTVDYWLLPPGG